MVDALQKIHPTPAMKVGSVLPQTIGVRQMVTMPLSAQGKVLGSLSKDAFERRTSTGSDLFSFFDWGFAQIFSQIASITVKKLRNTNYFYIVKACEEGKCLTSGWRPSLKKAFA